MTKPVFGFISGLIMSVLAVMPAAAAELIMVEEAGCVWCARWNRDVSEVYPKTAEGRIAPLRRIDIHADYPADLSFARPLYFTPTFVLVEAGRELGRIEGYPGEDFFWGLLGVILSEHTDFKGAS